MTTIRSTDFTGYVAEMLAELADLAHEHGMPQLRDAIAQAHAAACGSTLDAALHDIGREAAEAGRPYGLADGFR